MIENNNALNLEQCCRSGILLIYPCLPLEQGPQKYLTSVFSLQTKRIFAQLSLMNACKINFGRFVYRFGRNEWCLFCRREKESFFHILLNGPACSHLCAPAFSDLFNGSDRRRVVDGFWYLLRIRRLDTNENSQNFIWQKYYLREISFVGISVC